MVPKITFRGTKFGLDAYTYHFQVIVHSQASPVQQSRNAVRAKAYLDNKKDRGLGGQCDYLRRLLAQQAIMMMMIMITSLENDTSLLMHVVVHPCSLCGVPEQLPRGTLKPPPDGTETAVPLHEHRRGRRDVGGQP